MSTSTEPTVRHDDLAGRYEVVVDDEVVAFASHHARADGAEVFDHTVTEPAHRGQGLAAIVVQHAMDDVRARGGKVVPACWYVGQWLDAHPDYRDLVATSG